MVGAVSLGATLTLLVVHEVLKVHDLVSGGGPKEELRRFLAAYPDATVHTISPAGSKRALRPNPGDT